MASSSLTDRRSFATAIVILALFGTLTTVEIDDEICRIELEQIENEGARSRNAPDKNLTDTSLLWKILQARTLESDDRSGTNREQRRLANG